MNLKIIFKKKEILIDIKFYLNLKEVFIKLILNETRYQRDLDPKWILFREWDISHFFKILMGILIDKSIGL